MHLYFVACIIGSLWKHSVVPSTWGDQKAIDSADLCLPLCLVDWPMESFPADNISLQSSFHLLTCLQTEAWHLDGFCMIREPQESPNEGKGFAHMTWEKLVFLINFVGVYTKHNICIDYIGPASFQWVVTFAQVEVLKSDSADVMLYSFWKDNKLFNLYRCQYYINADIGIDTYCQKNCCITYLQEKNHTGQSHRLLHLIFEL